MKIGDKVRIVIFPHDTVYTATAIREMTNNTYYFLNNTHVPFTESELEVINE